MLAFDGLQSLGTSSATTITFASRSSARLRSSEVQGEASNPVAAAIESALEIAQEELRQLFGVLGVSEQARRAQGHTVNEGLERLQHDPRRQFEVRGTDLPAMGLEVGDRQGQPVLHDFRRQFRLLLGQRVVEAELVGVKRDEELYEPADRGAQWEARKTLRLPCEAGLEALVLARSGQLSLALSATAAALRDQHLEDRTESWDIPLRSQEKHQLEMYLGYLRFVQDRQDVRSVVESTGGPPGQR